MEQPMDSHDRSPDREEEGAAERAPRPRRRRFGFRPLGEDGSAMAEVAVLLPVYLVMSASVIIFGRLVLARQQVVEAARYVSWSRSGTRAIPQQQRTRALFFDRFPDAAVTITPTETPFRFNQQQLSDAVAERRIPNTNFQQDELQLGTRVLNNEGGGGSWLRRVAVRLEVSYAIGDFLVGRNQIATGASTQAVAIVRSDTERPTFAGGDGRPAGGRHPIEAYFDDGTFPASQPSWDGWDPDYEPDNWGPNDVRR